MSDLSSYELDDIIWDDFDRSEDHIVPHPYSAHGSRNSCEGDIFKKHRPEAAPVLSNAGEVFASDSICQGKEERETKASKMKRNMLQKEHWSNAPDAVLTASCDGDTVKDTLNLASDDTRLSSDCFKSSNVTSDLSFFNNDCEDKESSDLLYYGWPDIGNFEDVDRMLRSCDSSFGLEITGNNNELGWFTPEDPTGGTEEAIEMDFKFSCPEPAALKNILQDHDSPESNNKRSRYISESKEELELKDESNSSHPYPVYSHALNQKTAGIKSENEDLLSPSPKGSSHASNQVHSIESSGDPSFQRSAAKVNEQKSQHHSHGVQPLFAGDPRPMGIEGVQKGAMAEIGLLNVPESSSSCELDEISLEATSFHQLQKVMEQLDLRTKLCIRDSLYRLARSAEQRHNASLSGSAADYKDSGVLAGGTNKCSGFMGIESDTNPIDRSIAHLLFHRPLDSPNLPAPSPLKTNAMNHGSITSREEAAAESNNKMN